jgi:hypothetical protein
MKKIPQIDHMYHGSSYKRKTGGSRSERKIWKCFSIDFGDREEATS